MKRKELWKFGSLFSVCLAMHAAKQSKLKKAAGELSWGHHDTFGCELQRSQSKIMQLSRRCHRLNFNSPWAFVKKQFTGLNTVKSKQALLTMVSSAPKQKLLRVVKSKMRTFEDVNISAINKHFFNDRTAKNSFKDLKENMLQHFLFLI